MKLSTVIIFLVALVLLYLAYKYFFKENVTMPIIPNNIPAPKTIVVKNPCDDLPLIKEKIDNYYTQTIKAKGVYNLGVKVILNSWGIPIGQTISDPVILKNEFDSAYYNYRNEIIKYNSIVQGGKCGSSPLLDTTVIELGFYGGPQ